MSYRLRLVTERSLKTRIPVDIEERDLAMIKQFWHVARLLAFGVSSVSMAAALPPGTKVHFATCTLPGVEHGCVIATSAAVTFNVTAAKPGIRPFQWFQGTATVVNKVSFCQQGQIVENFVPDKQQALVGCVDLRAVKPRR